jgi:hypothetical protein
MGNEVVKERETLALARSHLKPENAFAYSICGEKNFINP